MSCNTTVLKTFRQELYYFRKEENCFDQSASGQMSQNKGSTLTAEFTETTDQQAQTYNIQQPIFLNQLPIVQNQQLVYQVEGVNNLNFANGNGQQNLVYIVIPGANENVQIETVPLEVVKKEKDGTVEFIKVGVEADGKEAGGVNEVQAEEAEKGEKYYLNNATMQVRNKKQDLTQI